MASHFWIPSSFIACVYAIAIGGIEMACLSQLKNCNVHVYERTGGQYKRISAFDHPADPERKPVIRVLYCGGVHYGKSVLPDRRILNATSSCIHNDDHVVMYIVVAYHNSY